MIAFKTYRSSVTALIIAALVSHASVPVLASALAPTHNLSRRACFSVEALQAPIVSSIRGKISFDEAISVQEARRLSMVSRSDRRAKGYSEEEIDRLEIRFDSLRESWGLALLITSGSLLLTGGLVGALDLSATSLPYVVFATQWITGAIAAPLWIHNHPLERRDYLLRHSATGVAHRMHAVAMMGSAISLQYFKSDDPGLLVILGVAFFGYGLTHWLRHWVHNAFVEPDWRLTYGGLSWNLQPSAEFVFERLEPGAEVVMPKSHSLETLRITASRYGVDFVKETKYGLELIVLSNSHFRRAVDISKVADEEIRPMVSALNIYQRPGQLVILPTMKPSAFDRLVKFADQNQIRIRYRGHAAGFHFRKSHAGVRHYVKGDPNNEFDQLKSIPEDLLEKMLTYVNVASKEQMKEDGISPRAIEGIFDHRDAGSTFDSIAEVAFWFAARTGSARRTLASLIHKLGAKFANKPAGTKPKGLPGRQTIALLVVFLAGHYSALSANHPVALRIAA